MSSCVVKRALTLICVLTGLSLLSGCGLKYDLYLPEDSSASQSAIATNSQESSSTSESAN